jgi:hypothetical protein
MTVCLHQLFNTQLIRPRLFLIAEAFMCAPQLAKETTRLYHNRGQPQSQPSSQRPASGLCAIMIYVCNTKYCVAMSGAQNDAQPLLPIRYSSQQTAASAATAATTAVVFTPLVRACAAVCLGKLCLQREESAKECVQLLVRELTSSEDVHMRNNCVLILADLCVR